MTAVPGNAPPRDVPPAPIGGVDNESNEPDALTAAAGVAGVAATQRCQFRYWVDELLWSQGRTATIQLEEVLNAMGGYRTGGPYKFANSSKGSSPVSSVLDLHQLQQGLAASVSALADTAGSSSSPVQNSSVPHPAEQQPCSEQQHQQSSSHMQSPASSSSRALPVATARPGAAAAAAEADASSDLDSNNPNNSSSAAKRPDDALLGYHHINQWDFLWTKSVYAIKAARHLQPGQLVSAIAGLNCLTMKKRMVQTLHMALGAQAFRIIPLSFCIPEELPTWQAWLSSPAAAAADTGLWMLKTGQDAGKGLRLVRTQQALQVAVKPPRNPTKSQNYIKVAQQYITNPLLIQGRKFHLRLWMVVTSHSPLRAYLYNQGLVLFSSEAYDQAQPIDGMGVKPAAGHVTNYARNEDTWVWGLDHLQQQLGQQKWQQLWQQMQLNTALTVAAVLGPMRAAHRWLQPSISNYGFQMLGLDYLVDEQMHPWLLEINSAPSIMAVHSNPQTCGLIKATKQSMLTDMMALVQHRVVPQDEAASSSSSRVRQLTWQQELGLELDNRGGFEPLMELFPLEQASIPWQDSDVQLRQLLQQRP